MYRPHGSLLQRLRRRFRRFQCRSRWSPLTLPNPPGSAPLHLSTRTLAPLSSLLSHLTTTMMDHDPMAGELTAALGGHKYNEHGGKVGGFCVRSFFWSFMVVLSSVPYPPRFAFFRTSNPIDRCTPGRSTRVNSLIKPSSVCTPPGGRIFFVLFSSSRRGRIFFVMREGQTWTTRTDVDHTSY